MKIFNPSVLVEMIYETPGRVGKSLRKLAHDMGVDDKYLSRQLHPEDTGAKLGVVDFVFLLSCSDLKPLDYIESIFDRVAIQINTKNVLQRDDWLTHIAGISKEAGEAVSELATAVADNKLTAQEVKKCKKETYEALQALAALWQDLKQYEREMGRKCEK